MKLKHILFAASGVAALIAGTSCSDSYLDEEMYSQYGTDVTNVNSKVLGLHYKYAQMWGWSDQQGYVGCWQDGTDVGAPGDVQGVETPFYKYAQLTSQNGGVSHTWGSLYGIISAANNIVNDANATAAEKAEAEFFRAYAYNMLVTLWGDVPIITELITTVRTDFTRQPVAEVDKLIEADITDAIANLPEVGKTKTESRINKDCARMLAAEVFLRIGMRDNSYFKKAEDVITPTIEGGNYKLITERYGKFTGEAGDYYADMFRWGNQRRSQGNTEGIWIFQMEYNNTVTGGTINAPQQRRNWVAAFHKIEGMVNADSLGGRGNGRLRLSNYVKHVAFNQNGIEKYDVRNSNYNIRRQLWYNKATMEITVKENGKDVKKTIPWRDSVWVRPNDPYRYDAKGANLDEKTFAALEEGGYEMKIVYTGDAAVWRASDTLNVMYPHTTKWGAYDPTDDFGWSMVKDWPLMRLGEAYLLRAEARFRQNNLAGAAEDINVLRDRAFKTAREEQGDATLGAVSASDITLDFILDERIRELVGEENRRMTLVRTGTLGERIKKAQAIETAPAEKIIEGYQDFNALLPIPLTEIQLNKDAVIEQNPGYN